MLDPKALHERAQARVRSESAVVDSFPTYVAHKLEEHYGLSENPRTICGVSTREYVVIPTRNRREHDATEAAGVVTSYQMAGFYSRVLDTNGVSLYSHMAVLICWDPEVIKASAAENTLYEPRTFKLYTTIMQYVQAERSMSDVPADVKAEMVINGVATTEWTCISILTPEMRYEVNVVGRYLWNDGYYLALRENTRRRGTWDLFVCWDQRITDNMGECDGKFVFNGTVPSTWN